MPAEERRKERIDIMPKLAEQAVQIKSLDDKVETLVKVIEGNGHTGLRDDMASVNTKMATMEIVLKSNIAGMDAINETLQDNFGKLDTRQDKLFEHIASNKMDIDIIKTGCEQHTEKRKEKDDRMFKVVCGLSFAMFSSGIGFIFWIIKNGIIKP